MYEFREFIVAGMRVKIFPAADPNVIDIRGEGGNVFFMATSTQKDFLPVLKGCFAAIEQALITSG